MGRRGIWIGLAVGAIFGCGDWQLRRNAATRPSESPPYAWQEEGTFPAPAPVEAAPASGTVAASTATAETEASLFAPETPTFTVEALPPASAAAPVASAPQNEPAAFYVQVFASRSREAAEAIRDDLKARFQQPTRLDFEAPYYKVRVGECSSDSACQELRSELHSAGYAAAYVVPAVGPSP